MISGEPAAYATDAERAGLAQILRRRRWVWGWAIAVIPLACVGGPLLHEGFTAFMIGWMAVWLGLIARHALSRCPRCGMLFNMSWVTGNPFTQRCLSCGLELHARPRSDVPEQRAPSGVNGED